MESASASNAGEVREAEEVMPRRVLPPMPPAMKIKVSVRVGLRTQVAEGRFDYAEGDPWMVVMGRIIPIVQPCVGSTVARDWVESNEFRLRLQPSKKISLQNCLELTPETCEECFRTAWARGNWVRDRQRNEPWLMYVMVPKMVVRSAGVHRITPGRVDEVQARVQSAAVSVSGRERPGNVEIALAVQRHLRDPQGDSMPVHFPEDEVARSAQQLDRVISRVQTRQPAMNPDDEWVVLDAEMQLRG